jgi:hypothetical protein
LCTQVNITPEEDKEVSLFVASVIRGAQKKEFLSMMAKKKSNVIVVRSCSSPTISMSPSSTIRRAPGVSPSASWSGAILSGKGDGQSSFLSVETNKLKTTLSQPVVKAPDISPSIQPSASWSGPILSGKGDGQSPFLSFETDKLKTTLSQAVAKGPDISSFLSVETNKLKTTLSQPVVKAVSIHFSVHSFLSCHVVNVLL